MMERCTGDGLESFGGLAVNSEPFLSAVVDLQVNLADICNLLVVSRT
jgi:hypothetical protein